jgi:putative lipoprotein
MQRLALSLVAIALVTAACGDDSNEASDDHLEGPVWELVTLVGTDLPDEAAPTLQLLDGNASGMAGCNNFNGTYTIEDRDLAFGPLATTRMGCPPGIDTVETAYLAALESVTSFSVDGNELILRDGEGTPVLFYEVPVGAL